METDWVLQCCCVMACALRCQLWGQSVAGGRPQVSGRGKPGALVHRSGRAGSFGAPPGNHQSALVVLLEGSCVLGLLLEWPWSHGVGLAGWLASSAALPKQTPNLAVGVSALQPAAVEAPVRSVAGSGRATHSGPGWLGVFARSHRARVPPPPPALTCCSHNPYDAFFQRHCRRPCPPHCTTTLLAILPADRPQPAVLTHLAHPPRAGLSRPWWRWVLPPRPRRSPGWAAGHSSFTPRGWSPCCACCPPTRRRARMHR